MIPWFILEEIFKYLDPHTLANLRLSCRQFNLIAKSFLFKTLHLHKLEIFSQQKLLENGKHTKVLKLDSYGDINDLYLSGSSLSEIFPNLVSLIVSCSLKIEELCFKILVQDLTKLVKLKQLRLPSSDFGFDIAEPLQAVIQKLDFLQAKGSLSILGNAHEYRGLKALLFEFGPFFAEYPIIQKPLPFDIVLLDGDVPFISSDPKSKLYCSWIEYSSILTRCLLKLSPLHYLQSKALIEQSCLTRKELLDNFYFTHSFCIVDKLLSIPNLVDHCKVHKYSSPTIQLCLSEFKNVPSLEIMLNDSIDLKSEEKFLTTKLSLTKDLDWHRNYFKWVITCFPNLQHFYVQYEITAELLPLQSNAFPKLLYFYCSVKQSDAFWTKLAKAAPNLRYVYTNSYSTILESLPLSLQIAPFRNIMGFGGGLAEISGFDF
ncbi:hypothetical protein DSO57_1024674 [Entomophthora muscae]|uniref:Uncharacterized protein n=1 Tax=Entomophthora muscae TaxID=34485 RepID=A0ACC2S4I2_9FUNG|nr:hypothetical protein DSO57_1024674 [Entomophthora muscae]